MSDKDQGWLSKSARWACLLLAAAFLLLGCTLVTGVGLTSRQLPEPLSWIAAHPTEAQAASHKPTISTPRPVPTVLSHTRLQPTPIPTATPTASTRQPTIRKISAQTNSLARAIVFSLVADLPPERQVTDILLWYDAELGHQVHRFAGPFSSSISLTYRLDTEREDLTTATDELDYWWLVRDTSGESARAGGTVPLEPAPQAHSATPAANPPPIDFTWAVSESQHYQFHFVPGSAAERDLQRIGPMAEAALARTRNSLEVEFDGKMDVYLVPRVFWQGAATYGDKVQLISYLDRNYTGVEFWSYFTHEGTHALAQDLAQPPGLPDDDGWPDGVLLEGLAVWASGGHYRPEPLDAWAAVVAGTNEYIPLGELRAGPFYDFQHEISYLEAASFVKFLIEQHGLERFKRLYGQVSGEEAHDQGLVKRLYGQDYDQLEIAWLDYLAGLDPAPEEARTWRLTLRSFDLMRRYETEMDPDARILPTSAPTGWTTKTLEIFLHRLEEPANVALETALIAAQESLHGGDLDGAARLLDDVAAALDGGGSGTGPEQPSLIARMAILEQVAAQDRAVLRADASAYLHTVSPTSSLALDEEIENRLRPPFTAYRQEVVRLDVDTDGLRASGVLMVHAKLADEIGEWEVNLPSERLDEDGQLFAVTLVRTEERWLMTGRQPIDPMLAPLPPVHEPSQSN